MKFWRVELYSYLHCTGTAGLRTEIFLFPKRLTVIWFMQLKSEAEHNLLTQFTIKCCCCPKMLLHCPLKTSQLVKSDLFELSLLKIFSTESSQRSAVCKKIPVSSLLTTESRYINGISLLFPLIKMKHSEREREREIVFLFFIFQW